MLSMRRMWSRAAIWAGRRWLSSLEEEGMSAVMEINNQKRDLILTILNSTATRREAQYYARKYPLMEENDIYKTGNGLPDERLNRMYSSYISKLLDNKIPENPETEGELLEAGEEMQLADTIRVMVVRIRGLEGLSAHTVKGIGSTLSKCIKLGASPVLVIGAESSAEMGSAVSLDSIKQSSRRLITLLEGSCDFQTRALPGLFDVDPLGRKAKFVLPELAIVPLFQGIIPVLTPIVMHGSQERLASSFDLMKYAIQSFSAVDKRFKAEHNTDSDFVTVEKIIFIDQEGGIPSLERAQSSHVLINLRQEYDDIKRELPKCNMSRHMRRVHMNNLDQMNSLLTLAPEATGIITTPKIATLHTLKRTTNPIVHNILTDRPTISSSLPVDLKKTPMLNTTIVKKGIDIKILLAGSPEKGLDLLELEKQGKIDLKKFKFLIDDSFGRDLDMNHYLNRVNGRVAGIIIAGEYDGGAILTWETPPCNTDRVVAYLDKFAVLKRLQGFPGLADIVFKAMLLSFKKELVWRSRRTNPVNKWYFDRSKANCCVPGTQWRMFYNGKRIPSEKDLVDYNSICAGIIPSFRH